MLIENQDKLDVLVQRYVQKIADRSNLFDRKERLESEIVRLNDELENATDQMNTLWDSYQEALAENWQDD